LPTSLFWYCKLTRTNNLLCGNRLLNCYDGQRALSKLITALFLFIENLKNWMKQYHTFKHNRFRNLRLGNVVIFLRFVLMLIVEKTIVWPKLKNWSKFLNAMLIKRSFRMSIKRIENGLNLYYIFQSLIRVSFASIIIAFCKKKPNLKSNFHFGRYIFVVYRAITQTM
jgi:hypothetical protein